MRFCPNVLRMTKNIAITGTGAISALGHGVPELWHNWIMSNSGITELGSSWDRITKTKLIAKCGDFSLDVERHFIRRLDRCSQLALGAAQQAWNEAEAPDYRSERIGVAISTGIGGLETLRKGIMELEAKDRVNPNTIPMSMPNCAAAAVSIWLNASGEIASPVSACAGGAEAIALAARWIADGDVDIAIAGGAEAIINVVGVRAFEALGALSEGEVNQPQPFGKLRNGFVLGEGAGAVVLENSDFAINRGAKIFGWILGCGSSADCYNMTASRPCGDGAKQAMAKAIKAANIDLNKICLIKAHATGTKGGDLAEMSALNSLWAGQEIKPIVIAPKSSIGHSISACGAIELIMALLSLRNKIAPGLCHQYEIDLKFQLPFASSHTELSGNTAMCNSFGFGGKNQSIIIRASN